MANEVGFFNPPDLLGPLVRTEDSFPYSLCRVMMYTQTKRGSILKGHAAQHQLSGTLLPLITKNHKNPHKEEILLRGFLSCSSVSEEHSSQFPS